MKNTLFLPVILLSFLLLVRLFFYYNERVIYEEKDSFKVTHSFSSEPKKNSHGQYFYISDIMISLPSYPRYLYGDTIEIAGVVSSLKTDTGRLLVVKNPTVKKIENKNPFVAASKFIRQRVEKAVFFAIPRQEAGLFVGILLGVRDKIDKEFYSKLRDTGVLHVTAASGQNVSILASLLLLFFERAVKRKQAILFTTLFVLAYAGITGFDPPIVRASVMAMISFGAMTLGRQQIGIFALFITGWGMVFYDPSMLENVSFQLSFLSTFGIMSLKPILDYLFKINILQFIRDDLTTTLAAQIATFPLIFAVFGSYSLTSLPINLLVLWTIPFIMMFGGIGSILSLFSPYLAATFVLLTFPFLVYFSTVIEVGSKYSVTVNSENISMLTVIGYYLILIGIVIKFRALQRRKI